MENLPTEYQNFIFLSRYSRFDWEKGRREKWPEAVKRYFDFFDKHVEKNFPESIDKYRKQRPKLEEYVLNLRTMPSMRALMTAGPALERDNMAGYNCSFIAISSPRDFDELMYTLMNGTGVGFSVERQFVSMLPEVAEDFHESDTVIRVPDSKVGWSSSFRELLSLLWAGKIPKWDMSKIRKAGEPLKTFGGRASGPEPLDDLFRFAVELMRKAAGRKLSSIECHDLVCKIADIVVVGGVRRSALLSGSNLSDDRIRNAKNGQWWNDYPYRALANNSAVYTEKPEFDIFMNEWLSLYESKSGERGIFSRVGAKRHTEKFGRRDTNHDFLTNPCGEIILRDKELCNLTEAVIRPEDTPEEIKDKVEIAAILGTLQSTLTDFRYVRKKWKDNCDEERLLGVSLTGIMDNKGMTGDWDMEKVLTELREHAVETNKKWSKALGINQSVAVTTVKPSGTVSQLVNSASGIHPRYSRYYIRTVRSDNKDPLAQFMIDKGFYYEKDQMKPETGYVFYFPMKVPDEAITGDEVGAMEQIRIWEQYKEHYTEHNPSITVHYNDDEFLEIGNWVWNNFDKITGISFLPKTDHIYKQAPYIPINKEEYEEWLESMPKDVDWAELGEYESTELGDLTEGSQELSCSAGNCEI